MNRTTQIFVVSVVMTFKIFGLLPFSLMEWKKSKFVIKISASEMSIIYILILMITIVFTNGFYGLPQILEECNNKAESLHEIMDFISCGMCGLTCIIIWIIFPLNHKQMEASAREFLAIDLFIQKHKYIEQLEFSLWPLIIITFIFVILWPILLSFEWMSDQTMNWFIWMCVYIMTVLPLGLYTLQYGLIMHLINFRFKLLNNAIGKFGADRMIPKYPFTIGQSSVEDAVTVKKFLSIKYAHQMIYNLTIAVSNFYSFPILLIMANACFLIIYIIYDVMMTCFMKSTVSGISFIISNGLWFVLTIFPIIVLITTLESVTHQYKRTPIEIVELVSRFKDCERLASEAEWFLREFRHNPMEFTAFGFFKLDNTFFQSILGTTITYLVIVLQFQSPRSKENQSMTQ